LSSLPVPALASTMEPADLADLLEWRRRKEEDLRRRDGWLALAGLHWLSEGRQTAGAHPTADVRLPAGSPDHLGDFEVVRGQVFFHPTRPDDVEGAPEPGEPLRPDTDEDATVLHVGEVTLVAIARGHRLGLRVWDNRRLATTTFAGRSWFAPRSDFVVQADFQPAPAEAMIAVPNAIGDVSDEPWLGTASFQLGGVSASLRAVPAGGGRLWFLFADPTNKSTTYPAGRFLVAEAAHADRVVLDFNRAYNPPCAFTAYATCPLPPSGNELPFPIDAGERYEQDD
jgi:uncharacterized protein (DUF1684 family)